MKPVKTEEGADYLMEMARVGGGVACATVDDGHVLVFSKEALANLLQQATNNGKDQVIVFIKRRDMSNAS